MKKLILLVLICVVGWQIYVKQSVPVITNADIKMQSTSTKKVKESSPVYEPIYTCDGRQHCSQMTSCEEATFFIKNCPNTKMDGDHDGVPCERQWCNKIP